MSYVRLGNSGRRLGRLARAHRLSGLGRLAALRGSRLGAQFRALGYDSGDYLPDSYSPATSPFYASNPVSAVSALSPSGGGWTPAQEAALASQGISTAGSLVAEALKPTPTVTYNAATGMYTATGGAAIPGGLSSLSSLSAFFPYLLLGGGLLLVISMARK